MKISDCFSALKTTSVISAPGLGAATKRSMLNFLSSFFSSAASFLGDPLPKRMEPKAAMGAPRSADTSRGDTGVAALCSGACSLPSRDVPSLAPSVAPSLASSTSPGGLEHAAACSLAGSREFVIREFVSSGFSCSV